MNDTFPKGLEGKQARTPGVSEQHVSVSLVVLWHEPAAPVVEHPELMRLSKRFMESTGDEPRVEATAEPARAPKAREAANIVNVDLGSLSSNNAALVASSEGERSNTYSRRRKLQVECLTSRGRWGSLHRPHRGSYIYTSMRQALALA